MFKRNFASQQLRRASRTFSQDESGAVLAIVALVLVPVLIGGAALAIDLGFAFSRQRQMQVAADAAAYSGAASLVQFAQGATLVDQNCKPEAISSASAAGFTNNANGVTVTPTCDVAAGKVTVAITEQRNWFLAGLFLPTNAYSSTVQAVAIVNQINDYCIIALCKPGTPNPGVLIKGSPTIQSQNNCGIISDCSGSCSVDTKGGTGVNVTVPIYTAGGSCLSGSANVNVTQNAYPTPDPYASFEQNTLANLNWPMPNAQNLPNSGSVSPGVYTNFSPSGTVNLQPGTYYVNGDFTLNGGAVVQGNGVTIIVSPTSNVRINGGSTFNIDSSGPPTNGIAFTGYGTNVVKFIGTAQFSGQGAIYFPNGEVDYNGNNGSGSNCVQIIANTLLISGNTNFDDNCFSRNDQSVNYKIRLIQ